MATNDNIQHGIDDNPSGDAEKGAALGGLGGAAVGAAAGSLAGPVGAIVGAVAGGLLGAGASGAAVAAVDAIDNDNTVSGVGTGVTPVANTTTATYDPTIATNVRPSSDAPVVGTDVGGHNIVTGEPATSEAGNTGLATGAVVGGLVGTAVGGPVGAVVGGTLGSLAGGVAGDAAEAADDADTVNAGASTYAATTTPSVASNNVDVHAGSGVGSTVVPPIASTTPDVNAGVGSPINHVSGALNQNNAGQGYAADHNYEGDAYRASAGIGQNPDTNLNPTRDTYSGTTSVGAVNQDADVAALGGASTPGIRAGFDDHNAPGIQTGGVTTAGTDTRGITEKAADALTGDHTDDKTGGTVLNEPTTNLSDAARNAGSSVSGAVHGVVGDVTTPGNGVPGVQTGGTTTAGADTRGITEKAADAITGDRVDDKTGGITR